MNLYFIHPIRGHLGLAALLALACGSFYGFCLTSFAKASSHFHSSHRPLPPHVQDTASRLRELEARLMEDKQHKVNQLAEHGEELKKLRAAISVANEKAAAVIPDDTPEKQAVLKLQKQQPDWRVLSLSDAESQFVIDVWTTKDTHGEQAKEILLASAKAWKDKHTAERQKRLNELEDINKIFKQGSAEVFTTLSLKGITPEETDPVLTAISKIILLLGTSRAVIGKNFTNSVGMEMVWIPDGKTGFWIGRSEVSTAAYKSLRGGESGDDIPAEKISFNEAIELVGILNDREAESKNILPPGQSL